MNLYRSISDVPRSSSTVLTVGTFDGIHRAHQAILQTVRERSSAIAARSLVITFDQHPRTVIDDASSLKLLTTLEERISLFRTFSVENLLVLPFTQEFSQLSFRDFYADFVLKYINIVEVVEGYNHHFGKGRGGDSTALLQLGNEFGFSVTLVPPVLEAEEPISSSRIRQALYEGNLDHANAMLGFPYFLEGTVVEGDKRGRKLGYPTANLRLSPEKLIPQRGIYFVDVRIETKSCYGIASIGVRPTFYSNGELLVEVHILDFQEELYGKSLRLSLLKRLRDEQKFESVDELIEQMNKDKEISTLLVKTFRVV